MAGPFAQEKHPMQMTQPLHSAAEATPDKIATACGDRSRSWREMRDRVSRLASGLQELGLERGDRVAILSMNSDRYLETYFATWWGGFAVVPMNVRWSAAENAYSLNDSGARVLLVDAAFAPMVPAIQSETEHELTLVYLDDEDRPDVMLAYETLIADATPVADAEMHGDDLAGIFYTGGTTGFPKGAMLSHQSLWCNGVFIAKHFRIESEDGYLHAAPMFHLADGAGSWGSSMAGATHYFIPSFAPGLAIAEIEARRPTHVLLVPTMIGMMLDDPGFSAERLASLKHLMYGASPMPEGLLRRTLKELPQVGLIQGYGQTELGPIVSTLPPEDHVTEGPHAGRLRSAGRAVYGLQVRIVDDDGKDLPNGQVGEIAVKGPHTMLGYWNKPEQTATALKDGWVHTGDGAYRDDDGYLYIVDRLKDMIVTGGENVFSAEVESAISTHPGVAAVAVIGVPSEKWGEAVHAIVVPKEGETPSEEEIIAHCRERIANYKLPRSVELRSEPLPLSGAGKVLKRELRAPHWEGRERGVN